MATDTELFAARRRRLVGMARATLDQLELGPRLARLMAVVDGWLRIGEESGAVPPWRRRLDECRDVRLLAVGKAAGQMARAALRIFGDQLPRPVRGLVVVPPGTGIGGLDGLRTIHGGHPEPTPGSFEAGHAALELLQGCDEQTVVLTLLSGGGSSLLERPAHDQISLADVGKLYRALITGDLDIVQINTVRKHLSAVKGGHLAVAAAPAEQITLYVCDVPDHLPSMVASGPTMPDPTTAADAVAILSTLDRLPGSTRAFLAERMTETPAPGHPAFARSHYFSVARNRDGVAALRDVAEADGFRVIEDVPSSDPPIESEVDRMLRRLAEHEPPVAVVSGGEVICPVQGSGTGGRNLEFVMRAAIRIAGQPIGVMSFGTDGIDGNSPAAGAVADGTTDARARMRLLDLRYHVETSNAWPVLNTLGDVIVTGPTGQNVRDLRLVVRWE